MAAATDGDALMQVLRSTVLALVRWHGVDLTARQLAIFLIVYRRDGPHTVGGLAARLNVVIPVISRALDRLCELDLVRRKLDPTDRRRVLLERTPAGQAFLAELRRAMAAAASKSAA
jgi:DNA-binding MarR family transcriptional regulator